MISFFTKPILILLGFLGAFFLTYGTSRYLHQSHKTLLCQVNHIEKSLHAQTEHVQMLQSVFQRFHHLSNLSLKNMKSFLKKAAEPHVEHMECSLLPQKILYQDKKFTIMKVPVYLYFTVKLDDHFWEFLKKLYKTFPGIMTSKSLSLEKILNRGESRAILKGSYHFEWYSVRSLSNGS
jgi:hypothetical protein